MGYRSKITSNYPYIDIMIAEYKDTYFVAVKVFLEKDGKLLILRDNFGDWDLRSKITSNYPYIDIMIAEYKDTYFVAVKVFLEKDGKLLILRDNFGDWDLPGG